MQNGLYSELKRDIEATAHMRGKIFTRFATSKGGPAFGISSSENISSSRYCCSDKTESKDPVREPFSDNGSFSVALDCNLRRAIAGEAGAYNGRDNVKIYRACN
jgi:hypothetical protein